MPRSTWLNQGNIEHFKFYILTSNSIRTLIFRHSLSSGEVPDDWRTANVAPIYKKGQKYTPANYRPVSLTCIASKLMEHMHCTSSIMKHANDHNILYDLQHGFRQHRSCETQLLQFVSDINENLESKQQTDLLIMDFSKAFDKVGHQRLLRKLDFYGIKGTTNRWIASFLRDRKQSVVVEGEKLEYVEVLSGVPQGSVLGPSLFLFYINDICDNLSSTVRLFADDTICYLAIKSKQDSQQLQEDLDRLGMWEKKWEMEFHQDKCEVIHITHNKKVIQHQYSLHGHILKSVDSAKYLGVTISSDFKWNCHIDNTVAKANRVLGFLRRNIKVRSTDLKEKAFKTLVPPTLEYAATIWDPHTAHNINRLEMVQRRAARYTTNIWERQASVTALLQKLGWITLQERRKISRLVMMYKITNGLVAIPVAQYVIPTTRPTRHCHALGFRIPQSRTESHKYSYFPRTVREWNALPASIPKAESLEAFKEGLTNYYSA